MFTTQRPYVPANKLPWFGVGIEAEDGTFIDLSSEVNSGIKLGDFVDIKYLESKTGIPDAYWVILDTETIKVRKFPVEGFVIV